MGHLLTESRNGLIVQACVIPKDESQMWEASLQLFSDFSMRPGQTVGADKGYGVKRLVKDAEGSALHHGQVPGVRGKRWMTRPSTRTPGKPFKNAKTCVNAACSTKSLTLCKQPQNDWHKINCIAKQIATVNPTSNHE